MENGLAFVAMLGTLLVGLACEAPDNSNGMPELMNILPVVFGTQGFHDHILRGFWRARIW